MANEILERLIEFKSDTYGASTELKQDNSLAAWSWIDATASWVEPTSWCLLAMKKLQAASIDPAAAARIDVGNRYLIDRACVTGGWNYGNPNVYGTNLIPHVPTTALALLAMQDHPEHPVVKRSLVRLAMDAPTEPSPMALALSLICMRVYGHESSAVRTALLAVCANRLRLNDPSENLHAVGVALCALGDGLAGMERFRLKAMAA